MPVTQSSNPYNRPLPPEIYRRRRIAAAVIAVVVLVVLALIVKAIVGGGDSSDTAAVTSTSRSAAAHTTGSKTPRTTSASGTASETTGAQGSEGSDGSGGSAGETTTDATGATSTTAEPDGQCTVDDLQLTVSAGAPTYAEGQQPDFYLAVSNPTGSDCVVDLDESPMSFEVFTLSDYARVWGDTDCNEPTLTGELDLAAGEQRTFALSGWSRTSSSPDDCTDRSPVGAGAYLLYGHLGDNISEPETFNLA